jgi:hypothetical protein
MAAMVRRATESAIRGSARAWVVWRGAPRACAREYRRDRYICGFATVSAAASKGSVHELD